MLERVEGVARTAVWHVLADRVRPLELAWAPDDPLTQGRGEVAARSVGNRLSAQDSPADQVPAPPAFGVVAQDQADLHSRFGSPRGQDVDRWDRRGIEQIAVAL